MGFCRHNLFGRKSEIEHRNPSFQITWIIVKENPSKENGNCLADAKVLSTHRCIAEDIFESFDELRDIRKCSIYGLISTSA